LGRIRRLLVGTFLTLALAGAVLVSQLSSRGQQLMAESDRAFDRGELEQATELARAAAAAYLPRAAHVERAHERLLAIASGAAIQGNRQAAIDAWLALRGVLIETAHPWSNTNALLQMTNERLAQLLANGLSPAHVEQAELVKQAYRANSASLSKLAVFRSLGAAAMLLGVWTWCNRGRATRTGFREHLARSLVPVVMLSGLTLWFLAAIGA
jgi:hypothetical protein